MSEPTPAQVGRLLEAMGQLPQLDLSETTGHLFFPGDLYLRALWRPAGTTIAGKVHKREHLFILAEGEMTIRGPDGDMLRVSAPYLCVSQPGTQRLTYAHVDSLAITVHKTAERDLAAVEADLVEPADWARIGTGNVPLLEKA